MSSRRLALISGSFPLALEEAEPSASLAATPPAATLTGLLHRVRSDEDLAEALLNGDADALTVLFKRHNRIVFGIARRILRNETEAEDCVQQIFIDVFRSIDQFDRDRASFKTWLLLFAYHRTLNRRRSLVAAHAFSTETLEEFMPELLAHSCNFEAQVRDRMLLKQALATLPPRQQRTIQLTYYEGLTAEEVSLRTGETVRVVRHNLYRGLEKLRHHLCSPIVSNGKGDPR